MKTVSYELHMQYRLYREFFRAVANPVRFGIIQHLREQPASVGELAGRLGLEQSHVSHALACLSRCGFVLRTAEGKQRIYSIAPAIEDILTKVEQQLDRYASQLEQCEVLADERRPKVVLGVLRERPPAVPPRRRRHSRHQARVQRAESLE
jgi:DNA-binding transcriptional ArsR family regulator